MNEWNACYKLVQNPLSYSFLSKNKYLNPSQSQFFTLFYGSGVKLGLSQEKGPWVGNLQE